MRSSTGRWVIGSDFFDRELELEILESRVREGNHLLLSGQRRMGKTSMARELGRRLKAEGWVFLFADVEGATCAEDVIADIAASVHPIRSISSRFAADMAAWFKDSFDEISALDFRVKIRAGLNAGTWRDRGDNLIRICAEHDKRILLVIDELPIFLKRLLRRDDGTQRVDEFLSWFRCVLQSLEGGSPVLIVSGSIGLEPLVRRLGLSDRINHLDPYRVGPWSRETSIECFEHLAREHNLLLADGVASDVYNSLGIGIPHHVQSFFARLRDHARMKNLEVLTTDDVDTVYRTALLGPSGLNDLVHYETRLKEGLDDDTFSLAMEVLAEAATQQAFTVDSRRALESLYSQVIEDVRNRVTDVLEVLVHDGYLEKHRGYRFSSLLLRDWWSARFRDHHVPLSERLNNE